MATAGPERDYLGVDIGTTSVKVCVARREAGGVRVIKSESRETGASLSVPCPAASREQSSFLIFSTLVQCLQGVGEVSSGIAGVGVCGQMHGVVLWKRNLLLEDVHNRAEFDSKVSNLITWEDGRCDEAFLSSLPPPSGRYQLKSGFGSCTLAWLARHKPTFLSQYQLAGTIMDLVTYVLCRLSAPVMSEQCAFSWGYYRSGGGGWDQEQLRTVGVDLEMLPRVSGPGDLVAGELASEVGGVKAGTRVSVGLGDLQCSVLSVFPTATDLVVNIGTSAQAVILSAAGGDAVEEGGALTKVPYFKNEDLLVAAALTGGNMIAKFVDILQSWCLELGGVEIRREAAYDKLIELGMQCLDTDLSISPLLLGERHAPERRGSVSGVRMENLSLGSVSSAVCRGVVSNLVDMLPLSIVRSRGIQRVVGCGSVLELNKLIQEHLKAEYGLPLRLFGNDANAAVGASIAISSLTEL